jgi:hypothetical protein
MTEFGVRYVIILKASSKPVGTITYLTPNS